MNYRMYHLTMYNLSEIQKGIQSYHAGMEYARRFYDHFDFQKWLKEEKTVVILNGGTSVTMEDHLEWLEGNGITCSCFREPDLNHSLSGIAFLVPEPVYDRKVFVDYDDYVESYQYINAGCEYSEYMGGSGNVLLREFINQFKLA